jgi:hypothetical protein
MALGSALIGQTTYQGNTPNEGGTISSSTLAGPFGGLSESVSSTPTIAYVADTANNRILGYASPVPVTGTITPAATFVLGQSGFGTAAPGTSATSSTAYGLASPSKVSVSDDGRLVVTDTGNNRVLIWNTLPTSASTAPDVIIGQTDISSNQSNMGLSAPTASTLSNPTGAMLNNNKLVIVDQNNNRVLIWNAAVGTLATGSAASVELGQVDNGSGSGFTTSTAGYFYTSSTGSQSVQFTTPTDVWTDGFSLVISDTGNNRVLYWSQVPSSNFTNAGVVVGQTQFSTTNPGVSQQLLNSPTGIFVASRALYVADTGNHRVLQFSAGWQTTIKGAPANYVFGQQDFTHSSYNDDDQNGVAGDQTNGQSNTLATQNTLHSPSGVFADNGGNLWVSDQSNNRIIAFPTNSNIDGSDTDGAGLVPNCNGYYPLPPDTNYNDN